MFLFEFYHQNQFVVFDVDGTHPVAGTFEFFDDELFVQPCDDEGHQVATDEVFVDETSHIGTHGISSGITQNDGQIRLVGGESLFGNGEPDEYFDESQNHR